MNATKYEVSICNERKVVWEGLVDAANTIDAQAQAIEQATLVSVASKVFYDYIFIAEASDASAFSF